MWWDLRCGPTLGGIGRRPRSGGLGASRREELGRDEARRAGMPQRSPGWRGEICVHVCVYMCDMCEMRALGGGKGEGRPNNPVLKRGRCCRRSITILFFVYCFCFLFFLFVCLCSFVFLYFWCVCVFLLVDLLIGMVSTGWPIRSYGSVS